MTIFTEMNKFLKCLNNNNNFIWRNLWNKKRFILFNRERKTFTNSDRQTHNFLLIQKWKQNSEHIFLFKFKFNRSKFHAEHSLCFLVTKSRNFLIFVNNQMLSQSIAYAERSNLEITLKLDEWKLSAKRNWTIKSRFNSLWLHYHYYRYHLSSLLSRLPALLICRFQS